MPQVVNGCGTWYYGSSNKVVYQGVCEHCHLQTQLEAYDTRLYVVVVFIPIIPLGKKRIIDNCTSCKMHKAIPHKAWIELNERLQQTTSDFEANPTDDEKLELAVQAAVSFRELSTLRSVAAILDKQAEPSAKSCYWVGIGFVEFNQYDEAKKYLRQSLDIEQDNDTREALAGVLLNEAQPEMAEPLVQHIVDQGIPDRANLIYHLAMSWQQAGNHDKALDAFKKVEKLAPHLVDDEDFRSIREESEKHLGTSVSVNAGKVLQQRESARKRAKFLRIAPAMLAVAVIGYLLTCYIMGLTRTVHIVNGVNVEYDVSINGESFHLLPYQAISASMPEGDFEVTFPNAPLSNTKFEGSFSTPFLTRPFSSAAVVINPDRAALLKKEYMVYAGPLDNPRVPDHEIFGGKVLYVLDDIDHPFEAPPQSMRAERGEVVTRSQLTQFIPSASMGFRTGALIMSDHVGTESMMDVCQQHVRMGSNVTDALAVVETLASDDAYSAFLNEVSEQRPVNLEVHLAYLSILDKADQLDDIRAAYDRLLKEQPDNINREFLVIAATGNTAANIERCEALCQDPKAPALAREWLASRLLISGRFEPALSLAEKNIAQQYDRWDSVAIAIRALIGLDRFDDAIKLAEQAELMPHQLAVSAFGEEAYIHGLRDDAKGIERVHNRLGRKFGMFDRVIQTELLNSIDGHVAYARKNFSRAAELFENSQQFEQTRFAAAIIREDLAGAEKLFDESQEMDSSDCACLYLLARKLNDDAAVSRNRDRLLKVLTEGSSDRLIARALTTPDDVDWDDVLLVNIFPRWKAAMLTVIGLEVPAHQQACFEMAQRLNFDRRFPHFLTQHFLDSDE